MSSLIFLRFSSVPLDLLHSSFCPASSLFISSESLYVSPLNLCTTSDLIYPSASWIRFALFSICFSVCSPPVLLLPSARLCLCLSSLFPLPPCPSTHRIVHTIKLPIYMLLSRCVLFYFFFLSLGTFSFPFHYTISYL